VRLGGLFPWKLIDMEQPAVTELLTRRGALQLYSDLRDRINSVAWYDFWWRRRMLELRKEFQPLFHALGLDLYLCSGCVGYGRGARLEYWLLFVDHSEAPSDFEKTIEGRELSWCDLFQPYGPRTLTQFSGEPDQAVQPLLSKTGKLDALGKT